MSRIALSGLILSLTLAAAPAALAQKQGRELSAALYAGANSIDPHFNASYPVRSLLMGVYESLFTIDENGAPIPMLAEGYTVSPDGLAYTIRLRRGVHFHNGKEMTAADVKASLERFGRLSPERIIMASVTAIETPDPATVVIRLKEPYPTLIDRLASPASPGSIIPAEEAGKDLNKTEPIGTGPFRIAEWVPDNHMTLKRFDGYSPDPSASGPNGFGGRKTVYLDTVTLRIMGEASARVAALEAGQVQIAEDVPPPAAKRLKAAGKFQVQDLLTFQMPVLFFNHQAPPTDNPKVRQAIQAALDMSEIMPAAADSGANQLNHALLYPGNALYSDATKELYNQNDPAKAKTLLAQAGYKGEPLVFNVGTLGFMSRMGVVIAEQLKAAGFTVKAQTMDLPTLLSSGNSDSGWNLITSGLGSQPFLGAYSYQRLLQGDFNVAREKNDPEMAALWTQFNAAADAAARRPVFAQIQARAIEQGYLSKLGDIGMTYAVAPGLTGFKAWNGAARFWNVWYQ